MKTYSKKTDLRQNLIFIFGYINRYKYSYGVGIVFIIATNFTAVLLPDYLRKSIDLIETDVFNSYDRIGDYVTIMIFLAIALFFSRSLSRIFFFNPARGIEHELKGRVLSKLTRLPSNFFFKQRPGTIISRINHDLQGVRLACGFALMQLFNTVASFSLIPYMMFRISPTLTLACIVPVVVCFGIVRIAMGRLSGLYVKRQQALQNLSEFSLTALAGIDTVQTYSMNRWSTSTFKNYNRDYLDTALKIAFLRSFFFPLFNYAEQFMKLVIIGYGGWMFFREELSIGDISALFAYAVLVAQPLMGLGRMATLLQQAMIGISSVQTILTAKEPAKISIQDSVPNFQKSNPNPILSVKNLCYAFPESNRDVLRNISFDIMPGQVLGILGEIGSGKTTLVNCVNKYLSVESGKIYWGGSDINAFSMSEWREYFRTVTQEPFLFSETVEDNIRFGDNEEIALSAEQWERIYYGAGLTAEIARFPARGKTMVGEKGIMLSGGQKQRISLARALLRPCDVLILDNVLSAVDYQTENFLLDQILKKDKIKSLLIVSHRTKAMERAHHILFLKNGKILESGTHKELIDYGGNYWKTWRLQNQGVDVG